MKLLINIIKFPVTLILAICFAIKRFKNEWFSDDIVEYEMRKFNSGDEDGLGLIYDEARYFMANNQIQIHILNILIWITIIYLFLK